MKRPPLISRVTVDAALEFSIPAAVVLGALASGGVLDPRWALIAWVGVLLVSLALVRPHLADLAALTAWLRALAQGQESDPPKFRRRVLLGNLPPVLGSIRRLWLQSRADLAASAKWHETLFDSLPSPLVLLTEGRRVVRMNRAGRAVFGRDLQGRDLAVTLRDPAVLEAVDAVLAGADGRETEVTLPIPVERIFLVQVERLAGDQKNAILSLYDVTATRRMEKMRADFVANASHELRTPLAAVLGFIETLKGPAADDAEARERFLDIMQEQATRMTRLVNDLLSLSRIELNEHSPPSDPVDLRRIVGTVVAAIGPLAAAKRMTLVTKFDPDLPDVRGQSDELAQLAQNLLDNAVKYGHEGTPVEVVLRSKNDGPVLFSVTDQGEGIERQHLPRLTERFYRVDNARSRKLGGTGLGLAIVKHIVNRHRGTLAIDSVPGRGSTFTVRLPKANP